LLYLVRRGGAEYRDFLAALADRVRDLVRLPPLLQPPELVVPDALADPFAIARPVPAVASVVTPPRKGVGPKHVEFIVVAAHQAELRTERHAVSAYGADFDEWCPYLPVLETRIGLLVQKVALDQNLTVGFLPVAQNIVSHLQGARAKNTLIVLVVDVWSLRLPTYRSYMNQFDGAERFTNAGALVVWNLSDNETLDHKHELVDALHSAFPNLTVMPDPPAFHQQLGTPDELVEKLRATLCELRRRITNFGEVMRKAEGIAPITKPLLVGPGGA
jgi:FxsC-like protein